MTVTPSLSGRPRFRTAAALAVVAVALAGCAPSQESLDATEESPTCGTPPTVLDLGRSSPNDEGKFAAFSTSGGDVWFTFTGFDHGGIFDPDVWHGMFFLGDVSEPPTYDAQTGRRTGVKMTEPFVEGRWILVNLAPGDYWIWASGSITVASCEPGAVFDPVLRPPLEWELKYLSPRPSTSASPGATPTPSPAG